MNYLPGTKIFFFPHLSDVLVQNLLDCENWHDEIIFILLSMVLLAMWYPMDLIYFNLSKCSSLDREDVLEELSFSVHVVSTVLAAEDLVRLQNVVDVCRQDRRALGDLLDR